MAYETTGIYLVSKVHFNNSLCSHQCSTIGHSFIIMFSISVSQPSVRAFAAKTCFLTITPVGDMIRHLQDLKCLRIIHNNRITRRAVVSFNSFCHFQSLFQTLISKVHPSPILEMHPVPFFLSSSNVHYFNNLSSLAWGKGKLFTLRTFIDI